MNQLVVILFIILICMIIGFSALINLLKKIIKKNNEIIKNNSNIEIKYDLEKSLDIKKCIDELIEYEITNKLKSYIPLHTKYDIIKIDADSKEIATNIYNSFKKEFITEEDLVFNTEFYYNYIVKRTITKFLLIVNEYNESIGGSI